MATEITRRRFVSLLGLSSVGVMIAGCSTTPPQPTAAPAKPAAAPTQAAPAQTAPATIAAAAAAKPASSTADWDALVAAANAEGKVVVQTPVGLGYRTAIEAFTKAYPKIQTEQAAFPDSATFLPKIMGERKAGIYSIDVAATTPVPVAQVYKPEGVIEPLRPILIHPEILDDKAWYGGLQTRFQDLTKTHIFKHQVSVTHSVFINTDLAPQDAIKSLDDLLDPKWRGKIVSSDLTQGYIYTPSVLWRDSKGEEFLRKLFVGQEPQLIRDRRQAVEGMIRGAGPIGVGIHPLIMREFQDQGLANNVFTPDFPGAGYNGGDVIGLFNKAPHPNAAKLFINWLLSKEGQIAWSTNTKTNSARLDIPVVDPSTAPGKVVYQDPTSEEWIPKLGETQDFLKKLGQ